MPTSPRSDWCSRFCGCRAPSEDPAQGGSQIAEPWQHKEKVDRAPAKCLAIQRAFIEGDDGGIGDEEQREEGFFAAIGDGALLIAAIEREKRPAERCKTESGQRKIALAIVEAQNHRNDGGGEGGRELRQDNITRCRKADAHGRQGGGREGKG